MVQQAMNGLGWGVYSFDHEGGNGQFEINFGYDDCLTTADRVTFFRLMAREITRKHGLIASFMPKPFADRMGSGAHFNMSLADLEQGHNLFAPADGSAAWVSEMGLQFMVELLRHMLAKQAAQPPAGGNDRDDDPEQRADQQAQAQRGLRRRFHFGQTMR